MSRQFQRPILEVRDLTKHYQPTGGILGEKPDPVKAVDGIDFDVYEAETIGIVGESGCGKSTAATAMIRLEEPTAGVVKYRGEDITDFDANQLKRFRRDVQMVFQDPDSSFDPRMSIGDAIAEPLIVQGMDDRDRRKQIVTDLLERVGLSPSDAARYPHELSGGQKQRIGLARALAVNPEIIIMDEPVSALDVSIQSEILQLIQQLQTEFGLTIIAISHDLTVIREICDRVAVMYLGELVEVGDAADLFDTPKHPYTRALLSAIPSPDPRNRGLGITLDGDVPDPGNPPSGCRFHTRCPEVIPPEDLELSQEVWRSVLHFRQRVRDGTLDLESIAQTAAIEVGMDHAAIDNLDVTDVPSSAVIDQLRRESDLPDELADGTANETLEQALQQLTNGKIEMARETLSRSFTTVCERVTPSLVSQGDRTVSCHLHTPPDEDASVTQQPSTEVDP